jgi:hypothetical protein
VHDQDAARTFGPQHEIQQICIENKDCDDLEKRKVYQVLPDDKAADEGYLRIVDESGEDYLYPESYFISVELPRKVQNALRIPG